MRKINTLYVVKYLFSISFFPKLIHECKPLFFHIFKGWKHRQHLDKSGLSAENLQNASQSTKLSWNDPKWENYSEYQNWFKM